MSIQNWIASQGTLVKILIGLAISALVYFPFRYLIYLANRDAKIIEANAPKLNERQRLELHATN